MVPDRWLAGEVARLTLALTDIAGAAADPGALRLKVKPPSGVVATYTYGIAAEVVKDSQGNYHADIPLTTAGEWRWRWESDTPNAGAVESFLSVSASTI